MPIKPPFSQRLGGSQPWIQGDFPETSRTALLHLLHDLVDRSYVKGWIDIDKEIRRIAREAPLVYDRDLAETFQEARISVENIIETLTWSKVFDFCERLYSHLASPPSHWNDYLEELEDSMPREEVQRYIVEELQRIFLEENLGYSFDQDGVRRRGRSHTIQQISKAEPTLGDPRLNTARQHYKKALHYFEHPTKPDYENTVKEAVCAVEAAARNLFPDTKSKTLGEVVKRIRGTGEGQIPKPISDTITGLYAYRNSGDGVSHGGARGGKATPAIAEYALSLAASQIILLHEVASEDKEEVPF